MEKTLQDVLPNDWGAHQPKKFRHLMDADYESLDQVAKDLRAQLMDAIHGFERSPITTPAICREQLEKRLLPRRKGKWDVVSLNENREKVYVNKNNANGEKGLRLVCVPSWDKFPTIESAEKYAKLPPKGVYLAIFTGSPSILDDAKAFNSFKKFTRKFPVADVVIWDDEDGVAKFYSVAAQVGSVGVEEFEFPPLNGNYNWKEYLC
jgi:hypothetical protein